MCLIKVTILTHCKLQGLASIEDVLPGVVVTITTITPTTKITNLTITILTFMRCNNVFVVNKTWHVSLDRGIHSWLEVADPFKAFISQPIHGVPFTGGMNLCDSVIGICCLVVCST